MRWRGRIGVAIAAFVALALPLKAAEAAPPVPADFSERATRSLKDHGVPSVSIALIRGGKIVWTAAYGEQSPGVPATPDTLYNIASMSKPISAEVVMRLAAQGKLSLDEPMSPYWVDPDIRQDPRHTRLTPRMSLAHRTGFANWRRETNKVLTFKFDPGTQTSYSGEGFEYVAKFTEMKMREPFDGLARRLVFAPIGMTRTAHAKQDWFAGRLALPFDKKFLEPEFADGWMASDLIYATAADYARFMISVMNDEGVSPSLAAQRTAIVDDAAPMVCKEGKLEGDACPKALGFGLGWAVLRYKNETIVMHGGSDPGVKTQGYFVPERRFGLVILTNGETGTKVIRDIAALADPASPYVAFLAMQAK